MIAAAGDALGGFAAILLWVVFLVVAILWICFPILVLSKFNELLKVQRAIHAALQSANIARAEIAKALQWMVDNWRKG
jgi:hypothetical protein